MRGWKTPGGEVLVELRGTYYLTTALGGMRRIFETTGETRYEVDGGTLYSVSDPDVRLPELDGLSPIPKRDMPSGDAVLDLVASFRRARDTDFWREESERDAERLRSPSQLPDLDDEGPLDVLLVPQHLVLYVVANGLLLWQESSIGCGPTAASRIERVVREKYGRQLRSWRSMLIYG